MRPLEHPERRVRDTYDIPSCRPRRGEAWGRTALTRSEPRPALPVESFTDPSFAEPRLMTALEESVAREPEAAEPATTRAATEQEAIAAMV